MPLFTVTMKSNPPPNEKDHLSTVSRVVFQRYRTKVCNL
jgi:hypothetical protein